MNEDGDGECDDLQQLQNTVLCLVGQVAALEMREQSANQPEVSPNGATIQAQLEAAQKAVKVLSDQVQAVRAELKSLVKPTIIYEPSF